MSTRSSIVELYSDSQYVLKGLNQWLKGWKAKGWKTADKKPVSNGVGPVVLGNSMLKAKQT